jgi:hypothetical protein
MNKELENKLTENAAEILAFVEKSSSFVVEQAPLYVQELIQFHFWSNLITVILLLIALGVTIPIFYKSMKIGIEDRWCSDLYFFSSVISGVIVLFMLIAIGTIGGPAIKECVKAKYAPRVLIIEKLRGQ